jgi:hypothetical protein
VFTQATYDKEGFPIRDPDSTTYTGAIETAEVFGKRIYLEAHQRGWERAAKKVILADGAIEAGCKKVIGSRLKQSDMFGTVCGANAIIALRCCHLNRQFEDYWEDRRAA